MPAPLSSCKYSVKRDIRCRCKGLCSAECISRGSGRAVRGPTPEGLARLCRRGRKYNGNRLSHCGIRRSRDTAGPAVCGIGRLNYAAAVKVTTPAEVTAAVPTVLVPPKVTSMGMSTVALPPMEAGLTAHAEYLSANTAELAVPA